MDTRPRITLLYAPTASGKTEASLSLASRIDCEIVSADSRQVFKHLDIGTAKATAEERACVPHHCIDYVEPDAAYSAGRWRQDALTAIQQIHESKRIPLVVGGSGLYLQSLAADLFDEDLSEAEKSRREDIRATLKTRLEQEGRDSLYDELQRLDPVSAALYSDRNPSRINRALEYVLLRGESLSQARRDRSRPSPFRVQTIVIMHDRETLNKRITIRTQRMWDAGLPEEVRSILELGYSPQIQALQSVGYNETLRYIAGDIDEAECIDLIAQNTRRFAKRQRTWARNQFADAVFINGSAEEIVNSLEKSILEFHQL